MSTRRSSEANRESAAAIKPHGKPWPRCGRSKGQIIDEGSVANSKTALRPRVKAMLAARVVIETGHTRQQGARPGEHFGHEVLVAIARKLRAISANERKSDTVDPRMLAKLGRLDVMLREAVSVRPEQVRQDLTLLPARARDGQPREIE